MITPVFALRAYRARNDDVALNSTSWTYAQDTAWTQDRDTPFRLRVHLAETAGGASNNVDWTMQYSVNGGAWTPLGDLIALSSNFADLDAITPSQLTSPGGSFLGGVGQEVSPSTYRISHVGSDYVEIEYNLLLPNTLSNGDTVTFRALANGATTTSGVTPTLTVNVPVPDTVDIYAQVFQSDETTALTDEVLVAANANLTTSYQDFTADFTLNATGLAANKATWDAARVRLRYAYTANDVPVTVRTTTVELAAVYSEAAAVHGVNIVETSASIAASASTQLTLEVDAVGGADPSVTWSSSDAGVATVDQNGLVTGVADGTCTITATSDYDGTKTDTCTITVADLPPGAKASGGTITQDGDYMVHTFTADGTFTPIEPIDVEYLLVGGGAGGGYSTFGRNGGGGAGGYLTNVGGNGALLPLAAAPYAIVVGPGGAAGDSGTPVGGSGGNTTALGKTALGGGGGGHAGTAAGADGGSGGGSPGNLTSPGSGLQPGSTDGGSGNDGGSGTGDDAGHGGGGAGAVGGTATTYVGGDGGDGLANDITGASTYYAGGGGGGARATDPNSAASSGGLGGGGAGGTETVGGQDGTANTGGGGGGGGRDAGVAAGAGGSGIVVIRYLIDAPTPPLVEASDVATSTGTNGSTASVTLPAYNAGDLVIVHIAYDGSSSTATTATPGAAPNGETVNRLVNLGFNPGDGTPDQWIDVVWWVATAAYAGGAYSYASDSTDPWVASVVTVPAGEFDGTNPISTQTALGGGSFGTSLTSDTGTLTANADDEYGLLVAWLGIDLEPTAGTPTGWTDRGETTSNAAITGVLSTRDGPVNASESVPSYAWDIANDGDTSANVVYIVRASAPPTAENLLPYSEDFVGQWALNDVTATGGFSDPMAGTNAVEVDSDGAGSYPSVQYDLTGPFQSERMTFSAYAKNVDATESALYVRGLTTTDSIRANFTWSGGVPTAGVTNVGANFTLVNRGVVDVGGGWYRLWLSFDVGATQESGLSIRPHNAWNNAAAGLTVQWFGAQVQHGGSPGAYIKTPAGGGAADLTALTSVASIGAATVGAVPLDALASSATIDAAAVAAAADELASGTTVAAAEADVWLVPLASTTATGAATVGAISLDELATATASNAATAGQVALPDGLVSATTVGVATLGAVGLDGLASGVTSGPAAVGAVAADGLASGVTSNAAGVGAVTLAPLNAPVTVVAPSRVRAALAALASGVGLDVAGVGAVGMDGSQAATASESGGVPSGAEDLAAATSASAVGTLTAGPVTLAEAASATREAALAARVALQGLGGSAALVAGLTAGLAPRGAVAPAAVGTLTVGPVALDGATVGAQVAGLPADVRLAGVVVATGLGAGRVGAVRLEALAGATRVGALVMGAELDGVTSLSVAAAAGVRASAGGVGVTTVVRGARVGSVRLSPLEAVLGVGRAGVRVDAGSAAAATTLGEAPSVRVDLSPTVAIASLKALRLRVALAGATAGVRVDAVSIGTLGMVEHPIGVDASIARTARSVDAERFLTAVDKSMTLTARDTGRER